MSALSSIITEQGVIVGCFVFLLWKVMQHQEIISKTQLQLTSAIQNIASEIKNIVGAINNLVARMDKHDERLENVEKIIIAKMNK